MKKILVLVCVSFGLLAAGCRKYDDTAIKNRLDGFEERLEDLEELCKEVNTNMASLQELLKAIQNNDVITGISAITKDGEVIGYTITFSKSDPITIYNGADGASGSVPEIGVKQDEDGVYYWTIGGEWLLDENGNKVQADSEGTAPRFKVEDGYWWVSYDEGKTWEQAGPASSEGSGESIFKDVDMSNDGYIVFILVDGTEIVVPTSTDNAYIDFLDNTVELLCIMNWDTNGDDKFSYEEAAAVESIGNVFQETNIISFNEFKYFTSVKSLEERAFDSCTQLCKLTLPESIEEIGKYALCQMSRLKELTVPASVTKIAELALIANPSLEKIAVAEGNPVFDSRNDCNAVIHTETKRLLVGCKNTVIPEDVEIIAQQAFLYSKVENVVIPNSVHTLEGQAFYECSNLKSIIIGNGVKTWGTQVFYKTPGEYTVNSNLLDYTSNQTLSPFFNSFMTKLTFGPDVTSIGGASITYCKNLSTINIPENVLTLGKNIFTNGSPASELVVDCRTIGESAFEGDDISELTIGNNVEIIEANAFKGGDYDTLIIGENVKEIGASAFQNTTAKNVVWGEKIESIGDKAFYSSGIPSAHLPSVKSIGCDAFMNCESLATVTVSKDLETVESRAFKGCWSLSDFDFSSLKYIKERAFEGTALKSVNLPEGLVEIGAYAFYGCNKVESCYIPSTVEIFGKRAFNLCTGDATIGCVPESVRAYDESPFTWCSFSRIVFTDKVERIPDYAVYSSELLTEVIFPDNLESIGRYAFYNCTALAKINLPPSLTTLGDYAFNQCKSLEEITISSSSLTDIGERVFYDCKSLKKATFPEGVTTLPAYLFAECYELSEVNLPNSLKEIQRNVFEDCDSLEEITIPENVEKMAFGVFRHADNLRTVYCKSKTPFEIDLGEVIMTGYPGRTFNDDLTKLTIYVPAESVEAYRNSWGYYSSVIQPFEF